MMKIFPGRVFLLLALALAMMWILTAPAFADPAQILLVVKELQVQQTQIANDQTKIDTRIVDVSEAVRVARIYTSRMGGAHKPPPKAKK